MSFSANVAASCPVGLIHLGQLPRSAWSWADFQSACAFVFAACAASNSCCEIVFCFSKSCGPVEIGLRLFGRGRGGVGVGLGHARGGLGGGDLGAHQFIGRDHRAQIGVLRNGRRLLLRNGDGVIRRINLDEQIVRVDELIVQDVNGQDLAVHPRRNGNDVAGDERVVGGFVRQESAKI